MCASHDPLSAAQQSFQDELVAAGLLVRMGVPGLYGRSGVFERAIENFERYVTTMAIGGPCEVFRFPPLISRENYLKTGHIHNFPDLMGSIDTFKGSDRDHLAMLQTKDQAGDWSKHLAPADVMLVPAICYPLYPTASGVLSAEGRTVDLQGYAFRHEPSIDPARMQSFRMREFVRMGSPAQALAHRDGWLKRSEEILRAVGLDAKPVIANDPFFGRGGRMMAATQVEQNLKYELVVAITSSEKPTAVASCNYHLDHMGHTFDIKTPDGNYAHTACVGFGLERVALALFKTHGLDPKQWPAAVQRALAP